MMRSIIGALCLVGVVGGVSHADEYKRLTLTVNAPYLLVPVYEVSAELALRPNFSVAARGGVGGTDYFDQESRIWEAGVQGTYYVWGNVNRGVQVGLDARYVSYENDGMLSGLGDGVAMGPFVGYKRVFGPGVTLGAQLGGEFVLFGDSEDPVVPHVLLSLGYSFWPTGDETVEAVASEEKDTRRPLDYHRGLMIGFSLGGGAATGDCDGCGGSGGMAVDGSLGWFVSPRWAIMYDSTGMVGLFSEENLGSAAIVLQSLAVQYWPHEDVWLKVGVGAATSISASVIEGEKYERGGGGTFAVGYEFHHDGPFNMDFQLRATHASFDSDTGGELGVDMFVGLVGVNWY